MRVALDATPLSLSSGGLPRFTAELSRALAENYPEDEFLLISDQPFAPPPDAPENLQASPGPRSGLARRWWSVGLPRELVRRRIDVFHGTNFEVPYAALRPAVLSLHDLSPWMDAGWHCGAERVRARTPRLIRLRLAAMVIAPSEAVRRAAIERFGIHPHRIRAVPHAPSRRLRAVEPPRRAPYFLFVGTLEPRKNVPLLVEAWRAVRRECPIDLVIAGRRRTDAPTIAGEPGLELAGEVTDDELSALYSGARAFLYPSLYEGFGLPVLEAMQCGAPVIASRDPAITEVAAGAALQLDARDAGAWVEALRAAAVEPEWLEGMRARGLARAAEYTWARTARLTREIYAEVMR